jgi:hypothetical protein
MSVDLKHLIRLVKRSRLLSYDERKSWFQKMERMNEEQLAKLQEVLEYAETINWEEELPKFAASVQRAERVVHSRLAFS